MATVANVKPLCGEAGSEPCGESIDTTLPRSSDAEGYLITLEAPSEKGIHLARIARGISNGDFRRIIVTAGAGISVAAGIPDFRSVGSGLYSRLKHLGVPAPEAAFDINYFRRNPQPFCRVAKELFPGKYSPTKAHYFSVLLERKGILLRHYTQNIDTLERLAGLSPELLVEAHGSFVDVYCIDCGAPGSLSEYKEDIFANRIPRCQNVLRNASGRSARQGSCSSPDACRAASSEERGTTSVSTDSCDLDSVTNLLHNLALSEELVAEPKLQGTSDDAQVQSITKNLEQLSIQKEQAAGAPSVSTKSVEKRCLGFLKPSITFFGESLNDRFFQLSAQDFPKADLLIIMGTSLQVMPFAGVVSLCKGSCYRLLVNREPLPLIDRYQPLKRSFNKKDGGIIGKTSSSENLSPCRTATDSGEEKSSESDPADDLPPGKDIFIESECDECVTQLCALLGWTQELEELREEGRNNSAGVGEPPQ